MGVTNNPLDAERLFAPRLLSSINQALGGSPSRWCCVSAETKVNRTINEVVSIGVSVHLETSVNHDSALAMLAPTCGACHLHEDERPAAFLSKRPTRTKTRGEDTAPSLFRQCLPRIWRRLSVWDQSNNAWTLAPMPPPSTVADHATMQALSTKLRERLKAAVERQWGASLPIDRWLRQPYSHLPPCR